MRFERNGKGFLDQSGILILQDGLRFSQKLAVSGNDFLFLQLNVYNHSLSADCLYSLSNKIKTKNLYSEFRIINKFALLFSRFHRKCLSVSIPQKRMWRNWQPRQT